MAKIITYDLRKPETSQDYTRLIAEIQNYPRWCKITESCWVINTPETCVQVRDYLKQFMDSNDRIYVGVLENNAAWSNVICNHDYLKTSLSQPG